MAQYFDLAALHIGIDGALGATAHLARYPEHELVANGFRHLECFGAVGIANHLNKSFTVTKVDEDDAAMVAPAMRPPAKGDGLIELRGTDQAAIVGAHDFEVEVRDEFD
jgi:hypothetical protein